MFVLQAYNECHSTKEKELLLQNLEVCSKKNIIVQCIYTEIVQMANYDYLMALQIIITVESDASGELNILSTQ